VLNLAVLWAFSPEEADDEGGLIAGDLVGRILAPVRRWTATVSRLPFLAGRATT
jgi:hypothetical protein